MKLLDLFCGAGGCSKGYNRAGFEVVGVDLKAQRNYPSEGLFGKKGFTFIQSDVFKWCENNKLSQFDIIHASPPCQAFSVLTPAKYKSNHKDLIDETRQLLIRSGKPYIIENVPGAPLKNTAVLLCGTMFGMRIRRHRLFETNIKLPLTPPCNHPSHILNPHNSEGRLRMYAEFGKGRDIEFYWKEEMGLYWMSNRKEWREAIPPAYTEYIGNQIMNTFQKGNS